MHEPECRDGIEWWPESAPTPIDVSTLPASGAISTAKRLPGSGQWVGLWGDFAGARIAYSATESFAVGTGAVFPYPTRPDDPEGVDLYFSKDTGASGTMSVGRFKTMAAARAWIGLQISLRSPGGGGLGPFPAASALADADANPTTTRIGSNNLGFNGTTWDRVRSLALNADNITLPTLGAMLAASQGLVVNDRTTSLDRMRQPDALAESLVVGTAISTATTGVKLSKTFGAGVNGRLTWVSCYGGATAGAVLQLELVRASTTYILNRLTTVAGNPNFPLGEAGPVPLLAGDTIQLNCTTAVGASTADLFIGSLQTRYVL